MPANFSSCNAFLSDCEAWCRRLACKHHAGEPPAPRTERPVILCMVLNESAARFSMPRTLVRGAAAEHLVRAGTNLPRQRVQLVQLVLQLWMFCPLGRKIGAQLLAEDDIRLDAIADMRDEIERVGEVSLDFLTFRPLLTVAVNLVEQPPHVAGCPADVL